MSSLEDTWGREKLVATLYDAGVQNPIIGRLAGYALWGFDIRKLFASISLVAQQPAGSHVLDVPCGGGLAFSGLQANHQLHYKALDFSPTMLARAKDKALSLGHSDIEFIQGDVTQLPFEDGSFDLVMTYNGIHCFPDPVAAMKEMARVVKPGGRLRGTLVIRGAGLRYDALYRVFVQRGWFGPGVSLATFSEQLAARGLMLETLDQSGALLVFEAVRQ